MSVPSSTSMNDASFTRTLGRARDFVMPGLLKGSILLCFLVLCLPTQAQNGHEVIFIVDQSGSMLKAHGPNGTWAPNDPLGNRVEAIMQAFETVQSLVDGNQSTGVSHHLRVIEFGSTARSRPDLAISISYDPSRPPGQIESVKNKIWSGLLGYGMGNTDTKAAFQEAQKLVNTIGGTPPDRIHIILITDGRPYVEGSSTDIGSPYQQELDRLLNDLRQHATLDVIGVTGNGLDQYWPTWGPYWTKVSAGRAYAGAQGTEISMHVDRILRERLGLPAQGVASNPYYCPPYLRSITFNVFRNQRGGRAQIKDALGRVIVPGLPGVTFVNEVTYDRITVEDPPPGLWELDRQSSRITVDLLYKQVTRLDPKSVVNAHIPNQFRYKVISDRQQPFQPLSNYPVQAVAQVTQPNGHQTNLPLAYDGQGVFSASSPYEFTSDGIARVLMTGTTVLPDKSIVTVFTNDEKLTITNKTLLVLNGSSSLPGVVSLLVGRREISPSISIQGLPNGALLSPRSVSDRPDDLIEFRLVGRDGLPLTDWQKMTVSGDKFVAKANARVRILSLPWLKRRSEIFAEVKVNDLLRSDFAVKELIRNGPEPVIDRDAAYPELRYNALAVPILLRESIWTYVLILSVALALISFITYVGYRYARKLFYYLSDTWIWQQRVTLVVQPAFQDEVIRPMTNDYLFSWKGAAVKVRVGTDGKPDWKPNWLKAKRLFRPWGGEAVVKLRYPVRAGKKENKHSVVLTATTVNQDSTSTMLIGVPANVQALVRVKRRGKNSTNQML
jgi:hypothetical protein